MTALRIICALAITLSAAQMPQAPQVSASRSAPVIPAAASFGGFGEQDQTRTGTPEVFGTRCRSGYAGRAAAGYGSDDGPRCVPAAGVPTHVAAEGPMPGRAFLRPPSHAEATGKLHGRPRTPQRPVAASKRVPAAVVTGRVGTVQLGGLASTYGPRFSEVWVALPRGPGWKFQVCGPGGCRTLVSTDAGPDRAMQRAGRIVDLPVGAFEAVCGKSWTVGLCKVVVEILGRTK